MLTTGAANNNTGGTADCSDTNKCLSEVYTDPQMIQSYCSDKAGTTKICDCPGGSPSNLCTFNSSGSSGIYCCK